MGPLIQGNIVLLKQARRLVENLSDVQYRNNDLPPFYSGVGKHIRHVLDFYGALLGRTGDRVDYDRRGREALLETDRPAAIRHIDAVRESLSALDDPEEVVWSKNDEAPSASAERGFRRSTVGRELQFLASHTVHHFAVIALLLHHQGVAPPEDFGLAPSTRAHRQQLNPEAPS